MDRNKIEREFFRGLNFLVEPLVRRGIASPSFTPASLIVLETVGFKSGLRRRTPLLALRLGKYTVVSTGRGKRSFWVKNLKKDSSVNYYIGGRSRDAQAYVTSSGSPDKAPGHFPPALTRLAKFLSDNAPDGWAFAILAPQSGSR